MAVKTERCTAIIEQGVVCVSENRAETQRQTFSLSAQLTLITLVIMNLKSKHSRTSPLCYLWPENVSPAKFSLLPPQSPNSLVLLSFVSSNQHNSLFLPARIPVSRGRT
ncbi:hypothetical protein ElyMa_006073400 [Elysia marginata]|uniref:Uncharacterized protein n=1 Tax=Elysia marginata TaxID=1093978 RepID=A0AAV4GPJ2_9GAST|nr:hypothetical protein ElyMa_006073400 [Elysia marginata]